MNTPPGERCSFCHILKTLISCLVLFVDWYELRGWLGRLFPPQNFIIYVWLIRYPPQNEVAMDTPKAISLVTVSSLHYEWMYIFFDMHNKALYAIYW